MSEGYEVLPLKWEPLEGERHCWVASGVNYWYAVFGRELWIRRTDVSHDQGRRVDCSSSSDAKAKAFAHHDKRIAKLVRSVKAKP